MVEEATSVPLIIVNALVKVFWLVIVVVSLVAGFEFLAGFAMAVFTISVVKTAGDKLVKHVKAKMGNS